MKKEKSKKRKNQDDKEKDDTFIRRMIEIHDRDRKKSVEELEIESNQYHEREFIKAFQRDCFIATSCYGEHSNITESLRRWRDKQTHVLSVSFIKIYYAGVGKYGAKILNRFSYLKPLARKTIILFTHILRIR